MQAISCGFLKTQWLMHGRRRMDPRKPPEDFRNPKYGWNRTEGSEYEYLSEDSKLVTWKEDFTIEVRPL